MAEWARVGIAKREGSGEWGVRPRVPGSSLAAVEALVVGGSGEWDCLAVGLL